MHNPGRAGQGALRRCPKGQCNHMLHVCRAGECVSVGGGGGRAVHPPQVMHAPPMAHGTPLMPSAPAMPKIGTKSVPCDGLMPAFVHACAQEKTSVITAEGQPLPPRWVVKDMMWQSMLALV